MKIKPILWTYFKTKSNTYPIKIRLTHQVSKKTITEYFPLGISVAKDEWDKKSGRVKSRENASAINLKIISKVNEIEKSYLNSGTIAKTEQSNFIQWFEDFYNRAKVKHGVYHQKKLNTVLNRLKAFRNPILLTDLTPGFLNQLETSMIKEGAHQNYIADTMVRIRTVINEIMKEGALEYHKNPFLHYKIKYTRTERKRLDIKDIEKLESVKLTGRTQLARDIYIFSFYCGGLRFGDICRLTAENVKDGRLIYQMNKTKVNRNIKMSPKALQIFKKYGYRFPLNIGDDRIEEVISSRNAEMNKHLKKACELAGINPVSMHTARHSIADYAVKQNLGTRELKGILGHQKIATTEIYMKSFYQEENDAVMDKLFKTNRNGKK